MSFPNISGSQSHSSKSPPVMRKDGVFLAKVTNIKDPDSLNRLKCKPVSVDKDIAETDWCYYLTPTAGKDYGQMFFPSVGDYVVLGYLDGDVHHPIVFGFYWANDNTPPYKIEQGKNTIRTIKTPAGVEIKLDDEGGKEKLTLTTPSGSVLQIDDEKKTIALQDKGSKNQLTISWEKGEVTLAADKKLTLSAGQTKLVLDSSGNAELKASNKVSVSGANIEFKGTAGFKAKAATVELAADASLNAKASGAVAIKGGIVQIN